MIAALLVRVLAWLERRAGAVELTGPVVVRDGSAWLRVGPGVTPRWFANEWEALAAS